MKKPSGTVSSQVIKNESYKNLSERLNMWILQLANTRWSIWALFICAFTDASFFPLPVTTFFLILIMMNDQMIIKYLFSIIAGTLTGALTGYVIGHFAWLKPDGEFTGFVHFLFNNIPGFSASVYEKVHSLFTRWDFWILCGATLTPLPYGMFAVSSGAFEINIFIFFLATLGSQGIKFIFLSFVTLKLGPQIRKLIQLKSKPVAIITKASVILAIMVLGAL